MIKKAKNNKKSEKNDTKGIFLKKKWQKKPNPANPNFTKNAKNKCKFHAKKAKPWH